jgi:hypothetical protein
MVDCQLFIETLRYVYSLETCVWGTNIDSC